MYVTGLEEKEKYLEKLIIIIWSIVLYILEMKTDACIQFTTILQLFIVYLCNYCSMASYCSWTTSYFR